MYVDAYLDTKTKGGDVIRVVERIDGERVYKDLTPEYSLYVEDSCGSIPSIRKTFTERKEYNNAFTLKKEAKLYKEQGLQVYESDCNVLFKTLAKEYYGSDSPVLNVVYLDIETDFDKKFGYAKPNDPFNRVTAISLTQRWTGKTYELVIPPVGMDVDYAQKIIDEINEETDENTLSILCNTEEDIFYMFFELISDADVLTGWNSEFYDIPYLINRAKRIFYEAIASKFCLWGQMPIAKETEHFGKIEQTYSLVGRIHLDYLALYKKHAGIVKQSYKLDLIAEDEVGQNKVPYNGTLDELYNKDFKKFVEYSIQDTKLLGLLDEKFDYINLHNSLAHQECVTIETTMGTVALVDTAIINESHKIGEVVFDKPSSYDFLDEEDQNPYEDEDDEFEGVENNEKCTAKAAGAWVQDPVTGIVEDIGCTDFNSLYPTVLRTLGMSTENILGQIRQTYTEEYLAKKISAQRVGKSAKFKPNWTEAWHGLFASIEYTMVMEETDDLLWVDLENGSSFQIVAKELKDIIFSTDSGIVISANGTLFDAKIQGVIPTILTRWYTERKQMQKMMLDYKHLALDGLGVEDINCDFDINKLKHMKTNNHVRQTKDFEEDPVRKLRSMINAKDYEGLSELMENNGFYVENGCFFLAKEDKEYASVASSFWKQNQMIRKILLNSLYGALLNKNSRFFDKRLGQSVTLTGRTMTKHMASRINEITTGEYKHVGGSVIYGDTDSVYFSVTHMLKQTGQMPEKPFTKEQIIDMYYEIGETVGKSFADFMHKSFNTGVERAKIVGADLEMVGSRGLFLKKKRYAILKYWEDGFRLDGEKNGKVVHGKLKNMGLEIKRSDTSKFIQDFLEDILMSLLVGESEQVLREKVFEFKNKFKDIEPYKKGSPKTVNNYTNLNQIFKRTGKCGVGHVKSAISWNLMRDAYDDNSVPEATDGTKVMVCKLKANPYGFNSVGYPIECAEYLPEWFKNLPFDEEEMEKSVINKKLENIFGILDMDLGIHVNSSLAKKDCFFDW